MIRFLEHYFSYSDDRGSIIGLNNVFKMEEINFVFSKKGSQRGKHYHRYTYELFIILKGKIKVLLYHIDDPQNIKELIVAPMQVFIISPNVFHSFQMLEDSEWINALDTKIKEGKQDIYTI